MGATGEFLKIDGINIHYVVEGVGPSVLLIHGWPTSLYIWRHLFPALLPAHTVYALDLPGFGKSDKPFDHPYTFSYFSHFIGRFIEALSINAPILVVHDIGGPSGILWALQNPGLIRALAILNAPIYPMRTPLDRLSQWMLRTPGISHLLLSKPGFGILFRSNVVNKEAITGDVVEQYASPFSDSRSRSVLKRTILCPLRLPNELDGLAARLQTLRIPIGLFFGAKDALCGEHMRRLALEMGEACRSFCLPRCGHYIQEDCPEDLARVLLNFLKENHM